MHVSYRRKRLKRSKSKFDDFIKQMMGGYNEYQPLHADRFCEDLVIQIREIAIWNVLEHKGTAIGKRAYSKDAQV